jgi:bifunctional non-homologous end joining protein LigD
MVKRARIVVASSASAEMPGFIKPQLATLKAKAPSGDQWLHEIKFDGYRVQAHLDKGRKRIFTRNGLDWTKRFSVIAGALDIPGQAILDGEVVVIHEGRTNFSELQAELAAGRQDRLVYYAFDLLWRNGDLRKLPQVERKRMLSDLLGENDIGLPVIYSEHLTGNGQAMFEHAAKLNFEGIVSKNAQAPVPFRSQRGLAEDQDRAARQIPGHRLRQGSERCGRAVPRKARGQGSRLHGQGGDRVVANGLESDQETA